MAHIIIIILLSAILACWLWAGSVHVLAAWEEMLLSRSVRKVNKAVTEFFENSGDFENGDYRVEIYRKGVK